MNTAEIIYEHLKALPEPAVQEVLDFVEFIEMKQKKSNQVTAAISTEWVSRLRHARGLWQGRNDLPDFQAVRRDLDRLQGADK